MTTALEFRDVTILFAQGAGRKREAAIERAERLDHRRAVGRRLVGLLQRVLDYVEANVVHLDVELDGGEEALGLAGGEFYLRGEAGIFEEGDDAGSVVSGEAGLGLGDFGGGDLADADGFAVEVFSVLGNGLESVAEGVAEVQYGAQAGFFFVLADDFGFDLAAARDDGGKGGGVLLLQLWQFALEAGE